MKQQITGNRNRAFSVSISALLFFILTIAPAAAAEKVTIFHAGSLTVPMAEMEKRFESANPEIDIVRESGGSTKMARMISEKNRSADIMASADYQVIDKTLIPEWADWNIRFATNQMVLCYTGKSRFADQIDDRNWYEILGRKEVSWGHSDPNLDPAGYRSLMVLQLAEKFYDKPGLYERLIANRSQENVRPKAKELVALLKKGKMDYGWEYLSVAVQHGLKYVRLDDPINLGNYQQDDYYSQATVKVTGKSPGSSITRTGKSITYGITLVKKAPNPTGAVKFLEYMLAPDGGLKILNEMGQPPFIPVRVSSQQVMDSLPENLSKLAEVRN